MTITDDGTFGTLTELETKLGRTFDTPDEQAQAEQALEVARGVVRDLTGQYLSFVADDEHVMDWRADLSLFLPELPVVDVTKVEALSFSDRTTWSDWPPDQLQWSLRTGEVRLACAPWPSWGWPTDWTWPGVALGGVRITYDHGYSPMPADLLDVVYGLAARALATPDGRALRQETLGQYSYALDPAALGAAGGSWSAGLTGPESAIIARYTIPNRA